MRGAAPDGGGSKSSKGRKGRRREMFIVLTVLIG
jgi:hypothetical protein